jgi:hypothetical protein
MNQQEEQDFIARLQKFKPSLPSNNFKVAFREQLRDTIISKQQTNQSSIKQLTFFTSMNKYVLPIAILAIVVAGTGYWYAQNAGTNQPLISLDSGNKLLPGKYSVTEVAQNSFGDLDKVSVISGENQKRTQSGGGSGGSAGNNPVSAGVAATDKMIAPSDPSIMPPYGDTFRFVYEGEKLGELANMQPVMKRLKPQQDETLVSRIVQMFSFGLVDMSKFNNARIQNFSFMEDKEYGMGINVDLNYGSVSIYQNYEKWPQVEYRCDATYCGSYPRIKAEDIPTDEQALAIADQFIKDYQVSLEGYGQPKVYDYGTNWRILYERSSVDKSTFAFPETINVVYPLTLEGKEVLDEGGNPTGIYVTIDIRSRKVNNLYGLETKQFEKSNYIGVNDTDRLMKVAERGGYNNGLYDGGSNRVTNLHLDTPTVEMVKIWYTTDYTKPGQDLYVPALVFPIKDWEKNNYWRKNVIVPLVKDILDNENRSQPIPLGAAAEPAANVKGVNVEDTPVTKEDPVQSN